MISPSDRDWPEDFACENGNYYCQCHVCKQAFVGHKRRVECKVCYMKDVVAVAKKFNEDAKEFCVRVPKGA